MIRQILISMRPRQWLKNVFVLAPLLFARRFTNLPDLLLALGASLTFCLLSGVVYIFNDLADLNEDRRHLDKRHRPLARGSLTPRVALLAALLIGGVVLIAAFLLTPGFGLVATAYLFLMLFYSWRLKQVVILDALVIAGGFILRVVAGGLAIAVHISEWLLICTFLLALFLALCKRRRELLLLGDEAVDHRQILAEYTPTLLDQMIAVVTSSTVMAYALYTLWPRTRAEVSPGLYLTLPFIIYGIFRYLFLVHRRDGGGEPGATLIADPALLLNVLLWGGAVIAILHYFPPVG